jgi:hypothetical protein
LIKPDNEQTLEAQAPAASSVYQSDISYTGSSTAPALAVSAKPDQLVLVDGIQRLSNVSRHNRWRGRRAALATRGCPRMNRVDQFIVNSPST